MEKTADFFYKEGTSDKVYQIVMKKEGSGWTVSYSYGRRGSTLKPGTWTETPVSLDEAEKIFKAEYNRRLSKGYKPLEDGDGMQALAQYNTVDKEQLQTGIHPQLLNPIEEDEVQTYIEDDDYVGQEKHDGKRILLKKEKNKLTAINRKGLAVGYPTAFDFCKDIKEDFVIDGESIGEKFYVFDILEYDSDLRNEPYSVRLKSLHKLFNKIANNEPFVEVKTAKTSVEKAKLFKELKARNAEGIVFKKLNAFYTAGRPASGGNQIKFKFYATASFIVLNVNKKRSVKVGLYDGNKLVNVGNVTIPPNKDVPQKDDIIEVQYLYAYRGGSIYQPIYIGLRDDIDEDACELSQLKYKAEVEEEEEA